MERTDFKVNTSKFGGWRFVTIHVVTCILVIIGVFAVVLMILPNIMDPLLRRICLSVVIILPPVWLWIEYNIIWKSAPENLRPTIDVFKYGQETSKNIWLAFSGVLITIFFQSPF